MNMSLTLPQSLQTDDDAAALRLLERYFGPGGRGSSYTGALWDSFDPSGCREQDVDRFTSDDLVSLALLSERVPGSAAYALLVADADRFAELLLAVGPDRDLGEQTEVVYDTDAGSQLYAAVRDLPQLGPTRASKLLARKRPRLMPIRDGVVEQVLGLDRQFWEPLRTALRDDHCALDLRLASLRLKAGVAPDVSRIRILDVLAWTEGKQRGL